MSSGSIYLDYAAATPVDNQVLKAMMPYFSEQFFNPSADYLLARKVKADLINARSEVAHCLGVKASEIIFTAGGTEANNLAIKGVMDQYPKAKILVSAVEHESVLSPAEKYDHVKVGVDKFGRVDLSHLTKSIDDLTVLVSVMYANNEVGTIEPIKQIAQTIQKIREERRSKGNKLPLLFHSDACQAANFLDLHVSRLGVDLMTLNGGKIYGPKQSGALFVRSGVILRPIIDGGGQETNLRSGTENVAGIIGFTRALSLAQQDRTNQTKDISKLRDYFIYSLSNTFKDKVTINGSVSLRLPNNVHATFEGADNERLLIKLDSLGIMAAAGSACSASNEESSHVLLAMGLSDKDARSSIRFSLGKGNSKAQIDKVVKALQTLVD